MNVKALIKHTRALELEIAQLTKVFNENKAKIQEFFDKKGLKEILVETLDKKDKDDVPLIAIKSERVYIDYFMDKLQEKLNKETFNKVAHKNYEIIDINSLVPLLQQAGVKANQFKDCIKTIIQPNKEALKQAYSLGEITKKDLEGCYSVKIVKYIQIKEQKKGDTN